MVLKYNVHEKHLHVSQKAYAWETNDKVKWSNQGAFNGELFIRVQEKHKIRYKSRSCCLPYVSRTKEETRGKELSETRA